MKYEYEIYLNSLTEGCLVGTNGDKIFNTEDEANKDALNFIVEDLSKEYEKFVNDFTIKVYEIDENNI